MKNRFNLIELLLAAFVVMLAATFAATMFSSGFRTGKLSYVKQNVTEAEAKVIALLRTDDYMFKGNIQPASDAGKELVDYNGWNTDVNDDNVVEMEVLSNQSGNSFLCRKFERSTNGTYAISFSAIVRILAIEQPDSDKFLFWSHEDAAWKESETLGQPGKYEKYGDYFKSVVLETSWPTELEYAKRSKHRVRLDVYNRGYAGSVTQEAGQ